MRRMLVVLTLLVAAGPVWAQQVAPAQSAQEQLAFYQRAVGVLQQQRNKAEDDVAQATAQAQAWKEQLDRALAEVKTLTDKLAASAPPASPVPPPSVVPPK